jgi:TctA family transporter
MDLLFDLFTGFFGMPVLLQLSSRHPSESWGPAYLVFMRAPRLSGIPAFAGMTVLG